MTIQPDTASAYLKKSAFCQIAHRIFLPNGHATGTDLLEALTICYPLVN